MLVGPPIRPKLPLLPTLDQGWEAILGYLKDLENVLDTHFSTIVGNSLGIIGARGFSSTGTAAQNFTKGVMAIGGLTQAAWIFTNAEMDATYMIFTQPATTPSVWLRSVTRQPTQVLFNFGAVVPSGITMDVLLLR